MFAYIGRQRSISSELFCVVLLLAVQAAVQSPQSTAQQPAAAPVFEVSTVKVNVSGSGSSHSSFNNDTFVATNIQIKNLMQYDAFGAPGPRIVGGPKWMESVRFDIEAKVDSSTADQLRTLPRAQRTEQLNAMFQQLLADRFQLKTHWETRELPVYTLTVAKNGPLLQKAAGPDDGAGTSAGTGQLQAVDATLGDIADVITQEASEELGRVVVDRTGLTGKYDIRLKWTPDLGDASAPARSDAASAQSGPSIFTAIQEQLGLKLEPAKAPIRVIVIDSIQMPSDN